jgi:hypothetical protein
VAPTTLHTEMTVSSKLQIVKAGSKSEKVTMENVKNQITPSKRKIVQSLAKMLQLGKKFVVVMEKLIIVVVI